MKTYLQTLIFFFFLSIGFNLQAQNDVAIIGWDGTSGDKILFAVLRDHAAGEVIYFTEEDYNSATDDFNTSEGHLAYTVPAGGLLDGEVISITETSTNIFSVGCAGGSAVIVSGSWSFSAADEMYAYSASNPSSPWNTITKIHCFTWSQVISIPAGQNPSTNHPDVLITSFNIGGGGGTNAQLLDAFRSNGTIAQYQSGSSWQQTGTGTVNFSCMDIGESALPIDLISFDAKSNRDKVIINWVTASEINNETFEVEHSTDGRTFSIIGSTPGRGNSLEKSSYQLIHDNPSNGVNYYRLKQIDFDGAFSYSEIISVEIEGRKTRLSAYPNPFESQILMSTDEVELVEGTSFYMYNSQGERIIEKMITDSNFNDPINTEHLSAGMYFIQFSNGELLRLVKL